MIYLGGPSQHDRVADSTNPRKPALLPFPSSLIKSAPTLKSSCKKVHEHLPIHGFPLLGTPDLIHGKLMQSKGSLTFVASCIKQVSMQHSVTGHTGLWSNCGVVFRVRHRVLNLSLIPGCALSDLRHQQHLPNNVASHYCGPGLKQAIWRKDCTALASQVGSPCL